MNRPLEIQTEHRFNDDLLLDEEDQQRANEVYPDFAFALDCEDLRSAFVLANKEAGKSKRIGRRFGLGAIAAATVAWFIASAEPLYTQASSRNILLLVSAALGIGGVLLGLWGNSSAKTKWLQARFLGERLRQFHFQNLVLRLPEMVAAAENSHLRTAFSEATTRHIKEFEQRFFDHAESEFNNCLGRPEGEYEWFGGFPKLGDVESLAPKTSQFFRAYRNLRIVHQINYATYKLGGPSSLFDFRPKYQETLIRAISACAIVVGFFLNLFQGAAIAMGTSWGTQPVIFVIAMWFMICGLMVRALEEGLQPQREIERYESYRASCLQKLDQFDLATDAAGRFAVMLALEQAAYDEMRLFLKFNRSAKFVM